MGAPHGSSCEAVNHCSCVGDFGVQQATGRQRIGEMRSTPRLSSRGRNLLFQCANLCLHENQSSIYDPI
jgi:hypothetical protein